MKHNSIDYSNCEFTMRCVRKHLIRDISYYLYVIDGFLYLSTEPESQIPKYQVPLTLENQIFWTIDKERTLTQFGFEYMGQVKYFVSRESELRELKKSIRNKVMFKDVSEFYQPMKLLGKGGSSKVYLVIDKDSKLDYASKCVEKRFLKEDGGYQSLFNEINIMAQLKHESIVNMEELFEGDNTFYIILEHLKGNSLHEVINRSPLTQDQIRMIMLQLLKGVNYMHTMGVIHRDLKPENIMFKDPFNLNSLRIVDFGLATLCDVDHYLFPKCGTPGYVAPEIANLKDLTYKYDKICDMFSVGCIFYKLITSKDLFPGNDYHDILKLNRKCSINLQGLSIYRTPQPAIDLIEKMLQANPANRISAAQALDHPYFSGIQAPINERKMKFQNSKKCEEKQKLFQTQNFKVERVNHLPTQKLPELKQLKTNQNEDEVEDEQISIKVPVLKSPRVIQYAKRKNLHLVGEGSPNEVQRKKILQRAPTQEIEYSPDTQSPDSARHKPTLLITSKQNENVQKKKIITNFSRYQQQQPIQEVDDEQKIV